MINKIRLTINGTPVGKGRPKYTKSGHAYTPSNTREYEDTIRTLYRMQYHGFKFAQGIPLDMRIRAFYPIPKSDSKGLHMKKSKNEIRPHNIKPDIDNVIKIVCDALNEMAYHDDTQIVDLQARKFYSDFPRVEILIKEAEMKGV